MTPSGNACQAYPLWKKAISPCLCHPVRSLLLLFTCWKLLIFLVLIGSPGPGYDTSTAILATTNQTGIEHSIRPLLFKFGRWDSIHFIHVAEKGYEYEQDWAWGYGYTQSLRYLSQLMSGEENDLYSIVKAGVVMSHICHLLSTLVLLKLSHIVFPENIPGMRSLPLLSATLHIISPAGAFLSAPYGEALFSLLNFSGFYSYISSLHQQQQDSRLRSNFTVLVSGTFFGLATLVRSNGLLSGTLFLYDAALTAWDIVSNGISFAKVQRFFCIILGGSLIFLGFTFPQFIAYRAYCESPTPRPWCQRWVPSIYAWVQSTYWNVGFLKYWTVSNIPLFLLAAPMLTLLWTSSMWGFGIQGYPGVVDSDNITITKASGKEARGVAFQRAVLIRLSIPQALLAISAFTTYHVQIINRLCSGYVVWYWFLAWLITQNKQRNIAWVIVNVVVIYGLVQAVLFGSFLPPA